jgi:hypothetical protein
MPTDEAGIYLTNGVFLYRLLGFVGGATDDTVELEDCYRLDVVRVSFTELCGRQLRVVVPEPS